MIYAKNLAGDMLPLSLSDRGGSYQEMEDRVRHLLAAQVCPDDPSRLVLLDHFPQGGIAIDPASTPLSEEALTDLLEELHVLSLEDQKGESEGDGKGEAQWSDGDIVTYMVKDPEICVHLLEKQYAMYTLEDDHQENPYFQIEILVRRGNVPYRPGYLDPDILHVYSFLFCLRTATFYPPSTWSIQEEEGYPYVCFASSGSTNVRTVSLEELFEAEPDPSGYMTRIRRAIHRKWIRFLRRKGQLSAAERRLDVIHPTELFPGEKQAWKALYWTAKTSRKSRGL